MNDLFLFLGGIAVGFMATVVCFLLWLGWQQYWIDQECNMEKYNDNINKK